VVIAAPGKLRLHRHGQISPILVIEILSAARIGRIVGVPIVRRVIPIVRGVRGVPGIPPREAKRNEIKTEKETVLMMKEEPIVVKETIMVNEAVVKEPIMVNETVIKEPIVVTKSKPTKPGSHESTRSASHKSSASHRTTRSASRESSHAMTRRGSSRDRQ
jgi:hypothetical protein